MAKPVSLASSCLLFLVLCISYEQLQVHAAAAAACPKPMKPVTKSQAKKLRPHGMYMLTDEPSTFSPLLPAKFITNPDFFNAKVKPQCTDGKSHHQWEVTYTINGTSIKQTLTEYPPATIPCSKWHDAQKWHNPEVIYGEIEPTDPIYGVNVNRLCKGGWRPMEITPTRREDIGYEQLMTDFFHFKVMPYTKKHRPYFYCNAGVQKMEFFRMGACFKKLASTVRIDGKKYGKGKRAARAWGQVDYTCYGENNVQTIYMTASMPFDLECNWNFKVE